MHDDDSLEVDRDRFETKVRRRQTARLAVIGVVTALAVAVALDNRQDVTVGWVVDEARLPLIVVLVAFFAVGVVAGRLLFRRSRD